jgi:hypothetical protein
MSNHSHLLADVRKAARTPRASRPYDQYTKKELWERLQAAEKAKAKFQRVATMAHDFAQAETGESRRRLFAVRDAIYAAS